MVKYSRFKADPDYDVAQYGRELERDGYVTFDRDIVEQAYNEMRCKEKVCKRLALQTMVYRTGGRVRLLNPVSIHMYLTDFEGCPQHYFEVRGRQGISLDAKKVLSKLVANNYAPEFLGYYMDYKSYNSKANKLGSILACDEVVGRNHWGKDLYKLPYTVNVQQNLRFNYKDYDIIGQIPKQFANTYSAPEGYCLAWGDFAQSDWRIAYNLFIRSPENDLIMNKYDDKYEALARLIAASNGHPFNLESFKAARPVYKVNTLATVYGTRGSLVPEDNQFIRMFTRFLFTCPKYVDYIGRIKDKAAMGLSVNVKSYFGYDQVVPKTTENAMINKCLNTPVQTCTSEIMILTVNKIVRMFREQGWSEDDVCVFMSRHDEPIFMLKEEVLRDAWIFKEFEKIYVDDWVPLELGFDYGYSYKVPDEELRSKAKYAIDANKTRVHFITPDAGISNDFNPITKTLKVYADWCTVDGKTIVTFYNAEGKCAHNAVVASVDPKAVSDSIKVTVREIAARLNPNDYEGVIVRSSLPNAQDSYAGQFISYVYDATPNMMMVNAIARYTVNCYCESKGIDCPEEMPSDDFMEEIKKTKRWGILDVQN